MLDDDVLDDDVLDDDVLDDDVLDGDVLDDVVLDDVVLDDVVLDIILLFSFSGAVVVLVFVTGLTVMETLAVLLVELLSFAVNVKLSDPVYPLFGL